ncbi:unnamed protein product [Linum trigynum]|uniref:Uncharacterized protein n=1 Tax=Linum trigynum TaxID=586398 RepID=A0AAV2FG57_9ROSI
MPPARKRLAKGNGQNVPARLTRSRIATASVDDIEEAQPPTHPRVKEAPSRKKRGKTKGYAVKKRLEEGQKIGGIIIEEGAKAPVGSNENLFKMEMGVVVRVLAPIRKFFWTEVTEEEKLPLFAKIESEFDIDMSDPHVREMVDGIIAARFRRFKHNCHQHYKKESDPIKARENPKKTVNIDDWKVLCDHFESPTFKKQSLANVQNRAMQIHPHTRGAKSQSQRLYELNNKEAAVEPTENDAEENVPAEASEPPELRVYADTRKKRDGQWINPATNAVKIAF